MGVTGKVSSNSPLGRKSWRNETLKQLKLTSDYNPFQPYIGKGLGNPIVSKVSPQAGKGHMITYDFTGALEGSVIVGADTILIGTGEQKRKYYINTYMEELGTEVYNGNKFDLVNIGVNDPTNDKNHRESIEMLATVYNSKIIPQFMFDTFQHFLTPIGEAGGVNPISTARGIIYNVAQGSEVINKDILDRIQLVAKTGKGYDFAPAGVSATMPLMPVSGTKSGDNGLLYWFVDPYTYSFMLRGDIMSEFQYSDVRGEGNRANTRKVGRVGNIVVIEMPAYVGRNNPMGDAAFYDASAITGIDPATGQKGAINVAGMRRFDTSNGVPEGAASFDSSQAMDYRTFIVGASAILYPKGMPPDYRLQPSTDYERTSSSAVLWWMAIKKVVLNIEAAHDDNAVGKISGVDNFMTVIISAI